MLEKFKSRKFITCIVGVLFGVLTSLSSIYGLDGDTIQIIAGIVSGTITSVLSVCTYIKVEGKLDEAGIKKLTEAGEKVADTIKVIQNEMEEDINE